MLRRTSHHASGSRGDRRTFAVRRRCLKRGWGAASLLVLAAFACKPTSRAKSPDKLIGKGAERVDPKLLPNRAAVDPKFPPNPPSFPLVNVPEKSVGPFLARRRDTSMAAYIGSGGSPGHRIISLPIAADGTPFDPQVVADVSADATMMVVRPGGGDQPAYVVAWTDLTDRGEALSVTGVTATGKPRSPAVEVARTKDDIVWIEVVPTPRGEVAVWVEETRDSGGNLFAIALDAEGKPRGLPSVVVRGILGWQAVATANGAGIAILTRKAQNDDAAKATTTIAWLRLDAEARAIGTPLVIGTSTQRVVDIDVARVGPRFVFAWTRRGAPEPEVMVATVDADGTPASLTPPRSITTRSGGASLVDAVSGIGPSDPGVLAWEETTHLARGTRRLHLVPLPVAGFADSAGAATVAHGESAVLEVDTAGVPEIVPLEQGYGVLARLRTCAEPPILGVPCDDPVPAPTFVRLDSHFAVTQTQPIFVDQTQNRATLAWGLSCNGPECLVLAAGAESPVEVRVVRIAPETNRFRAPVPAAPSPDAPHVVAVDTLASSDLYSELSVASVKGVPLLASITTESVAKTDGYVGATVSVSPLDGSGMARGSSVVLTKHARPEGGVAVAAAEGISGGAVAWVGRENGHAAVHVTRVDANGKRTNDIQLTTAGGETSDVALAWAGGGWIVAWVDTRDGNGEVYATKVDPELRRIAREVRITNAPGDASDVAVLAEPGKDGPIVWIAWADPRESPRDGMADIYVTRVKGSDVTPLGPEQRVLATVPHSRSPELAPGTAMGNAAGGVSLAWIEEAPAGADPAGASVYGAMIGALDEQGKLVGDPYRTRGAGEGFPTSIAIDRVGDFLHVALVRSTRDDVFLDAMTLGGAVVQRPFALFGLEGPPSMDVAIGILGDGIYFNDQFEGSTDGRIRRATVEWRR